MTTKMRLMLGLAVLAFLISALRLMTVPPLPISFLDFAGGLGVGVLIGLLITWAGTRGV